MLGAGLVRLNSLKTKVSLSMMGCIFFSILLVGCIAIYYSVTDSEHNAEQNILLNSSDNARDLGTTLACIETGVNTLADAAKGEVGDIGRFKSDRDYVESCAQALAPIGLNCGKNVEGAISYYVRFNPDYSHPTSGLFGTRENQNASFQTFPCTDISKYDKNDMEHVGWYYIPVNRGKPTWMNPYMNANINVYMISYVVPLVAGDGTSLGIAGMDVDFSVIQKKIAGARLYETGYAMLVNSENQVLASKEGDKTASLQELSPELAAYVTGDAPTGVLAYQQQGEDFVAGYAVLQNGMRYVMVVPKTEVQAASRHLVLVIVIGMLVVLMLGAAGGHFFSGHMLKPLGELREGAQHMAAGDLTFAMEVETNDEIGDVAAAFNDMAGHLNQVLSKISVASEQVAGGARNISDSGNMLAKGAAAQASSVEELSASIAEINVQTGHTADNASEANSLTGKAKSMAQVGNERMEHMMVAMDDIGASSKNISRIIKAIDEIAFQTNILALNAAVEAARAGQHGKGFAVVAEEVRNLAGRSAKAARETTEIIEQSLARVEAGTVLANETAEALKEITQVVGEAADYVGEIAGASQKQRQALEMLNQGVNQVSQVVQANSSTAEESAAASQELSSQAELLQEAIHGFKLR